MSDDVMIPYETTLFVRDHCLCLHAQRAARALARRFDDAAMTPAMRALSIRTRGAPAWAGAQTSAQTALWLDPATVLEVSGGSTPLVTQFFGVASFGPAASTATRASTVIGVSAITRSDAVSPHDAASSRPSASTCSAPRPPSAAPGKRSGTI